MEHVWPGLYLKIAPDIISIEEFDDFISSFKSASREKMFGMDEFKFRQITAIGILNDEGWCNPFHGRELFDQFAVISGDASVLLE